MCDDGRIYSIMNKKDKQLDKAKKWKTIAVEEQWLEELRKEAAKEDRSPTSMLGRILKERYAPK
jgi:hypothetical protein